MVERNFEQSLKILKMVLGWTGIYILQKKHDNGIAYFTKSCTFYFNFIWLGPVVVGEFYWAVEGIFTGESFDVICTCVPCFTLCFLVIVTVNSLYFNRGIIENVIEKLRVIHPKGEELKDADERTIVKNNLKFLNTLMICFCYLNLVVVIVFASSTLLSMAYDYIHTGKTELKVLFRIKYFFEVTTPSRWPLAYIHQVGAMVIATIGFVSSSSMFYTFCIYLKMHFRLLCLGFENFVSKNNEAETRENFSKAVKRHRMLIEIVEQIELLYSKSTLCNIVSSSLLICLSGFIVTFVHDAAVVSPFVLFLVMNLTQISLMCYFGDMLNSASTAVSQAVYNSLWYEAELTMQKSVLIVIIRAHKPCKVTAMKFADLNLNALSAILRTSWSYFALLKTMYD